MSKKVLLKICKRCSVNFNTYEPTLLYCNDNCRKKHIYEIHRGIEKKIESAPCVNCGRLINKNNHKFYCNKECRKNVTKAEMREEYNLNNFYKPRKRIPKSAISYQELIKRSEYKRLYDNFHINRIIRGFK